MSGLDYTVDLEFTPNPNSLKYVTRPDLMERGAVTFARAEDAVGKSTLAEKLFAIEGISAVMVGKNFVTITLSNHNKLTEINDRVIDTVKAALQSGEKVVSDDALGNRNSVANSDIEKQIVEILDAEIRPAVAMDGGDITFEKYQDGIVFLHMQGACAGCPSSTATLKMGIENRLREKIPEIVEVVAV
ncbi:NifU family protein [bacterium]|nr:NifU family protein [bacterium]